MQEKELEKAMSIMELGELVQEKYDKGQAITDAEIDELCKYTKITKEEMMMELEKAKQQGIEDERLRALEPSDEELQKEWEEKDKKYQKLAEEGANLTEEQMEEISDFYSMDIDEMFGSPEERATAPIQVKQSKDIVGKVTLFGSVIRGIRNIFK